MDPAQTEEGNGTSNMTAGHRCALYHSLSIGNVHYYYGGPCPDYDPPESMEFSPNHPSQTGCENFPGDHCFPALAEAMQDAPEGPRGNFSGIPEYLSKEPELFHRCQILSKVDCRFKVPVNGQEFPVCCRLFIAVLLPAKDAAQEPPGGWKLLPVYVGQQVEDEDYSRMLPTAELVRVTAPRSCVVELNNLRYSVHTKVKLQ